MVRMKFFVAAISMLMPLACAAGVTADMARNMPLGALAQKLLGESGLLMIDVDRPRFEGILGPVRFYSNATVTGSQFGMCESDWVTVTFDQTGKIETLSSERRYGVVGDTYRTAGHWSEKEKESVCAPVKSTRNYFPAPDSISAESLAWYVDAISGNGPFANQSFSYTCTGVCAPDRGDLKWLRLEKIDSVRKIDCPISALKWPSCFEVTVGKGEVGPFPKHFRIYGSTYANKVVISNVVADVWSTLA